MEVLEGPKFPSYFWFLILSFSLLALRPRHEFSSRLRHTGHTQQPPHTGWHKYNHIKRKKSPSMYLLSFFVASPRKAVEEGAPVQATRRRRRRNRSGRGFSTGFSVLCQKYTPPPFRFRAKKMGALQETPSFVSLASITCGRICVLYVRVFCPYRNVWRQFGRTFLQCGDATSGFYCGSATGVFIRRQKKLHHTQECLVVYLYCLQCTQSTPNDGVTFPPHLFPGGSGERR